MNKRIVYIISIFSVILIFSVGFLKISKVEASVDTMSQNIVDSYQDKGVVTYKDSEITVRSFGNDERIANAIEDVSNTNYGINPLTTVTGPGGVAKLNAGSNGRSLYWMVKPKSPWPWYFGGNVVINYYSGKHRTQAVSGAGAIGSSCSGVVTMNKNKGGYAKLNGQATSINSAYFKVMPGVGTSF